MNGNEGWIWDDEEICVMKDSRRGKKWIFIKLQEKSSKNFQELPNAPLKLILVTTNKSI